MDIDLYRHIAKKRGDFVEGQLHPEADLCLCESDGLDDAELLLRKVSLDEYKPETFMNNNLGGRVIHLNFHNLRI